MAEERFVEVMPGCLVVHTTAGDVMFGCPAEVLKVFKKKNLAVPKQIVLPSYFYNNGLVQAALEFILYNFLFVQQGFFRGEKLTVVGTAAQVERMRKILRLTLLGPTEEQMLAWRIDRRTRERALALSRHFALKKVGTREVAEIDDFIEFKVFDGDAEVNLAGVKICQKELNLFAIIDTEDEIPVDINLFTIQKPPIPLEPNEALPPRPILGATALSKCTSGLTRPAIPPALCFG
ncbi:hypothetical protein HZB94_01540 [Candidatus Falkowbacteria bacterium]|nr:hypothetical protein [Candidatus Falkowbacteria bacterium]